ncbi:MAG: rhodanese-like domain-containing protein [Gammaproteobacteria bacterium]|nr:rhodanese-like domain-containing protein [Gammaproteobacteria bacterium]
MENFMAFVAEEWILTGAFIVLSVLLVRNILDSSFSGVNHIGINEAVRLINNEAHVLDVRLENEFKQAHLQNASHIPVGALESRARELDKLKQQAIIVYCQSGNRSVRGAQILKKHGFEQVYNLRGGISAWIQANMPVVSGAVGKKKKAKAA